MNTSPPKSEDTLAHAVLCLLPAVLLLAHWDWVVRGAPINGADYATYYFPALRAYSRWLTQGHLPLWDDHLFAGYPSVAEGQLSLLHPLRLALLKWAGIHGDGLWVYLHGLIAGLGMYAYTRLLSRSRLAAVLAAYGMAFCGFFAVRVVHPNIYAAEAWIPWILFFAEKAARGRNLPVAFVGLAFPSALQWLSGHPHIPLMTGYYVGLYLVLRAWVFRDDPGSPRPWRPVLVGAGGLLAGIALAGVQVVPLLQDVLFGGSERAEGVTYSFNSLGSLPPWGALLPVFPAFYGTGGVTDALFGSGGSSAQAYYWLKDLSGNALAWETQVYPGALASALGIFAIWKLRKEARVKAHATLVLTCLLFAFGKWTPAFWVLHFLPGLSFARMPSRALLFVGISLLALAPFALDALRERASELRPVWLRYSRIALLGLVGLVFISGGAYRLASKPIRQHWEKSAVRSAERTAEQYADGDEQTRTERLTYAREYDDDLDARIRRATSFVSGQTTTNLCLLALVFWLVSGWAGSARKSHWRWSAALVALALVDLFWYWSYFGARGVDAADPYAPPPYMDKVDPSLRAFSLISVQEVVPGPWERLRETLPTHLNEAWGLSSPSGHTSMAPGSYWATTYWLRNPDVAGPLRLKWAKQEEAKLRLLGVKTLIAPTKAGQAPWPLLYEDEVVRVWEVPSPLPLAFLTRSTDALDPSWPEKLEEMIPTAEAGAFTQKFVESAFTEGLTALPQATPDEAEYEIELEEPATFVRTQRLTPSWRALLDGEEIPVIKAAGFFQAAAVPAGRHRLRFEYRPRSFKTGGIVSAASGLFLFLCLGMGLWREVRRKSGSASREDGEPHP